MRMAVFGEQHLAQPALHQQLLHLRLEVFGIAREVFHGGSIFMLLN